MLFSYLITADAFHTGWYSILPSSSLLYQLLFLPCLFGGFAGMMEVMVFFISREGEDASIGRRSRRMKSDGIVRFTPDLYDWTQGKACIYKQCKRKFYTMGSIIRDR